jgi:uncharacterized protein YfdQ (DUF2303 family)
MTEHNTEAGTIAGLAQLASKVDVHIVDVTDGRSTIERRVYGRGIDGDLVLVDTIEIAQLKREDAKKGPDRLAGVVKVHTPESLIHYATRHRDSETSTLWGDVDRGRLTLVLNDHQGSVGDVRGDADWGDHRVVLDLQPSPEWTAWNGLNERWVSQEALAEFLEEHQVEVVQPEGSDLLEVTRTFQATVGATFRRAQSLHSGQVQLTWQEEGEAKAGSSGQLEVPRQFIVRLRPFIGADYVEIQGQFRYRVNSGELSLGYRLLNLDEHRRTAVEQVLATVADALGLTALEGVAPEPRR